MMKKNLCDSCATDCGHYIEPGEFVVECGAYRPPVTNGDYIRTMSNDELAAFYAANQCPLGAEGFPDNCGECWLAWLQQPYKEDET